MEFSLVVTLKKEKRLQSSQRRSLYNKTYEKYGNRCYICGISLNDHNKTIDHIQPLSMWGANSVDNVRPCCKKCNEKKGNRTLYQFENSYLKDEAINSFYRGVRIPDNILE